MVFKGVIIEESLEDKDVLKKVKIISTKVEQVTPEHKTPWVKQWTLHTIEVSDDKVKDVAEKISKSIDTKHKSSWYADLKNKKFHYVIFPNKVFLIHRDSKKEYDEATKYGISIGIPDYQVDFSKFVQEWKR